MDRLRYRIFAMGSFLTTGPIVAVFLLFVTVVPVCAHFLLNLNVRIFHVEHVADGLVVHLRMPMPYLVADKLGDAEGDALPDPAPYTTNARENGQLVHFVNKEQLASDPLGLGRIAEKSLDVAVDGNRLRGSVDAVNLHAIGAEPGFATLDEARSVFSNPIVPGDVPDALYVGDAIVDVKIRYPLAGTITAYELSSLLDPGLPDQETTANLILDYGSDQPRIYRTRGLMADPILVSGSHLGSIRTFVWEGVRHILEGLDHVLFVICMILGAATLRDLIARVTGFTLGHTVTLISGFFGLAPQGAWFIPTVETLIALSIIYAAADAVLRAPMDSSGNRRAVAVTTLIGLLHGFGFSFMLQNILKVDAPNVWQSLLAFNIGVEIGQLVIVVAIWPLVLFLRSRPAPVWRIASLTIAATASLMASFWVVERVGAVFS